MLDGGNAEAAVLLLQSQPRDADTMMLLAETHVASKNAEEARKAAEAAVAFDHGHEGARQLIAKLRIEERDFEGAFDALRPLIDHAVREGSVRKAIAMLLPIANPALPAAQERLLELYRTTGDRPKVLETLQALARECWDRGDRAASARHYREILEVEPENAEARSRAGVAATAPAPPAEEEGQDLVVEFDESLLEDVPATSAPTPRADAVPLLDEEPLPEAKSAPAPIPFVPASPKPSIENTAVRQMRAEEAAWKDALTEAEVFAKYGLVEKAAEKYRLMLRRRPREIPARRRFVELLAEVKSPGLDAEARALIEALRESGQDLEAEAVRSRYLPAGPASPAAGAAAFGLASPPTAATGADAEAGVAGPAAPPVPEPARASAPPVDMEFAFDAGLGRVLDDEMAKFQRVEPEPATAPPAFDEMSLFSDEQRFFNLAAELEKELEEEEAPAAPALEGAGEEVSLEEIFREFKRGVEQQLSPEDYETHYNLGIAYKEMGLTDEAIGEFQIAAKDPARAVECCSMLGLCFAEKGLAPLAIQWFQKGLENPRIRDEERWGVQYDLAGVFEQTGDASRAYETYLAIYGENSNYRDVAARVKALESSSGR
jgi:tetratricopeptide (TPR) repeat protein